MRYFKYLFACIPSLLCLIGNISGGFFTALNILFSMVLLPILEWYLPERNDLNDDKDDNFLPTALLIILSILHATVGITLILGIINNKLNGIYLVLAILSSGINAGTNGIVVAHELIHRKEIMLRVLGILNLLQVNYGHFYIEHIKGHHKYVGTDADPATAKFGESLHHFILRTVPGQLISAFQIENERLFHQSKFSYLKNFVLIILVIEIMLSLSILALFGFKALIAFLLYAVVAIFLLEYVNYIEHYGLKRTDSKKFEAHHAWQSNKVTSRLGLIELSRHADHHLKAYKPYHTLNSHPGYYLPSGYYGMFYVALVPSWWFKMINPIIINNKQNFN
jgi:alkane 1-monooxygenase